MRLADLVTVEVNNEDCVVLKVKEGKQIELISLGYFRGNETMFRLTKGYQHTCTVWYSDGKSFSWDWGDLGHTLVSDEVSKKGDIIQHCIEKDLGIMLR